MRPEPFPEELRWLVHRHLWTGLDTGPLRHLLDTVAVVTTKEQDLREAEDALYSAVRGAHAAGNSWGLIGAVLGITRQNAYRKYGGRAD